jgi:hypothetical protein
MEFRERAEAVMSEVLSSKDEMPICAEATRVAMAHEKNGEARTADLLRRLVAVIGQLVEEGNHLRGQIPNSPDETPAPPISVEIRALFNKAIGVQYRNKFSYSFETEQEAERAFHFIGGIGELQMSRSPSETTCSECERLRMVIKVLLIEVNRAEGDYGIGLAMTKAEKAIGWSVLDQPPDKAAHPLGQCANPWCDTCRPKPPGCICLSVHPSDPMCTYSPEKTPAEGPL